MKQPTTIQEKRAIKFAVELLTKHDYGYTITVPSRALADELTSKGTKISFMTVIAYWKCLERITALSFKKVLCFRKAFYFIAVEV